MWGKDPLVSVKREPSEDIIAEEALGELDREHSK